MIVESIHVENFLSHGDSKVDFTSSPLWLIYGKNGSGKSALFDALECALYGIHRAGERQHTDLLIKHGAKEAVVEVVVQLHGLRYRVTHAFHRKQSNDGSIYRWDMVRREWDRINIDGESSKKVWEWLQPYLPDHDLFRSAIYLRQSDTAHFFGENVQNRIDRFAKIIDLSAYTNLSKKAKARCDQAEARMKEAEAQRKEQGDVSDQAEKDLNLRLIKAKTEEQDAGEALQKVKIILTGAIEWQWLTAEQERQSTSQQEQLDLLKDCEVILTAAAKVREWDRDAVAMTNYWNLVNNANSQEQNAQKARGEVRELIRQRDDKKAELEKDQSEQLNLKEERIPAAEDELQHLEKEYRVISHEMEVATKRKEAEEAGNRAAELSGAEAILIEWQNRLYALPYLHQLAEARQETETSRTALAPAQQALEQRQKEKGQVEQSLEGLDEILESRRKAYEATQQRSQQFNVEIAGLQGQVQSHRSLKGDEARCPVCDQPLDATAHEHVAQALKEEQEHLTSLLVLQEQADQEEATAKKILKKVEGEHQKAGDAVNQAKKDLALAEQSLETVNQRIQRAEGKLEEIRSFVEQRYTTYTAQVLEVTQSWIAREEKRVKAGLSAAQTDKEKYQKANDDQAKALVRLELLRAQRPDPVVLLGENLDAQTLATRLEEVRKKRDGQEKSQKDLCDQLEKINSRIEKENEAFHRLDATIAELEKHAGAAEKQDQDYRNQAKEIGAALSEKWSPVLASSGIYEKAKAEIDGLRPAAERSDALAQASGQLERIKAELSRLSQEMEQVPHEHRISVEKAQLDVDETQARLDEAKANCIAMDSELKDLKNRKKRTEELGQKMRQAEEESKDWRMLAELLKEHGEVQAWITGQVQQQIVSEINLVLDKLNDPLQAILGTPARKSQIDMQDILVIDQTDPSLDPEDLEKTARHYNLLSGGEQFRLALALALALHRRVAGNEAGTILVDEGFGNLDSEHRDELAKQMADTSHGILQLGFANAIVLCSHSSEVQDQFLDRWVVIKEHGIAHVAMVSAERED